MCCSAAHTQLLLGFLHPCPAALEHNGIKCLRRSHSQVNPIPALHAAAPAAQVCDEICQVLTDEQFRGKMVVVLAGYEAQVEELLAVNPGLKSRFSERLLFPDFTAKDAAQLLRQQLGSNWSLTLSSEAAEQLPSLTQQVGGCASHQGRGAARPGNRNRLGRMMKHCWVLVQRGEVDFLPAASSSEC